jgi:hypothetical protein
MEYFQKRIAFYPVIARVYRGLKMVGAVRFELTTF